MDISHIRRYDVVASRGGTYLFIPGGEAITGGEVCKQYGIPRKVLEEYRNRGLCGAVKLAMEDWRCDDRDLERLGTIMALHNMGFFTEEVETYMRLLLRGAVTEGERLAMLNKRWGQTLDEIHLKEKQLARMDNLRHELRINGGGRS
nr:MerR family transcriptional regulator [Pseudoflavonifractor phocaeensis]